MAETLGSHVERLTPDVVFTEAGRLIDQIDPSSDSPKRRKDFVKGSYKGVHIIFGSNTQVLTLTKDIGQGEKEEIYLRQANGYWPSAPDAQVESELKLSKFKKRRFGLKQTISSKKNTPQVIKEIEALIG